MVWSFLMIFNGLTKAIQEATSLSNFKNLIRQDKTNSSVISFKR